MALIKCPECGKEISDTAKQCPNCGYMLKTKVDTVKETATVAGNSVREFLKKYGLGVIPITLLVIGWGYLFIGYSCDIYDGFEGGYNSWTNQSYIKTPFKDGGFWLPLILTVVLPLTIFLCSKRACDIDANTPQQIKSIRKKGLLFITLFIVGFSALTTTFCIGYSNAKEEREMVSEQLSRTEGNTHKGKWEYAGETNLAGARIHYATILAEEDESIVLCLTYDPDNYIEVNDLVVKYFDKSISIVSNRATIKRGISFKFDDGGIINLTPSTSPSNDVYITDKSISIRDEYKDFGRLMQLLKTSKVCKVEITTSNGIKTYTFNVAGLNWPAF